MGIITRIRVSWLVAYYCRVYVRWISRGGKGGGVLGHHFVCRGDCPFYKEAFRSMCRLHTLFPFHGCLRTCFAFGYVWTTADTPLGCLSRVGVVMVCCILLGGVLQ